MIGSNPSPIILFFNNLLLFFFSTFSEKKIIKFLSILLYFDFQFQKKNEKFQTTIHCISNNIFHVFCWDRYQILGTSTLKKKQSVSYTCIFELHLKFCLLARLQTSLFLRPLKYCNSTMPALSINIDISHPSPKPMANDTNEYKNDEQLLAVFQYN